MVRSSFYTIIFINMVTIAIVSPRAVNISNSWMLPQEGFSVFYRYFRDRITWYEADAVCEFHHAHLVTADNSFQYDAIRAYLKELDIAENVWIGLSKAVDRPNFTWRDFQTLKEDDHWQQQIPQDNGAICVSMDPSADYLWTPKACGGPEVASFVCELPVPSWAMGPKGCLLTELPSLTVLYIPEEMALEMTSDCGLDGTKKIVCKGNADSKEILKQLACSLSPDEFDERPQKTLANLISSVAPEMFSEDFQNSIRTTKMWSLNTIHTDYAMATRHRRETENTLNPSSTKSTTDISENRAISATINGVNLSTKVDSSVSTLEQATDDKLPESLKQKVTKMFEQTTESLPKSQSSDKYSAAIIGQGELFDLTENDTINVDNETLKQGKDFIVEIQSPNLNITIDNSSQTTDIFFKDQFSETIDDNEVNQTTQESTNLSTITFEVTSENPNYRKADFSNKVVKETSKNATESNNLQNILLEDDVINNTATEVDNNEISSDFSKEATSERPLFLKKKLLPKALIPKTESSTFSALEEEPPTQPRPNRQRQLTRPQRRSFYPYFFSRVLG